MKSFKPYGLICSLLLGCGQATNEAETHPSPSQNVAGVGGASELDPEPSTPGGAAGQRSSSPQDAGTSTPDVPSTDAGSEPDSGSADAGSELSDAGSNPEPKGKRVFVTSQRYPADLRSAGSASNGSEGADKICQTLADASELGGTWKAWLSSSSNNAIERIVGDGPWFGMDGTLLFPNRASLAVVPKSGITFDEQRNMPDPFYEVWTGSALGGIHLQASARSTTTCQDWTATLDRKDVCGRVGELRSKTETWTDLTCARCSPIARHLYCFEQ